MADTREINGNPTTQEAMNDHTKAEGQTRSDKIMEYKTMFDEAKTKGLERELEQARKQNNNLKKVIRQNEEIARKRECKITNIEQTRALLASELASVEQSKAQIARERVDIEMARAELASQQAAVEKEKARLEIQEKGIIRIAKSNTPAISVAKDSSDLSKSSEFHIIRGALDTIKKVSKAMGHPSLLLSNIPFVYQARDTAIPRSSEMFYLWRGFRAATLPCSTTNVNLLTIDIFRPTETSKLSGARYDPPTVKQCFAMDHQHLDTFVVRKSNLKLPPPSKFLSKRQVLYNKFMKPGCWTIQNETLLMQLCSIDGIEEHLDREAMYGMPIGKLSYPGRCLFNSNQSDVKMPPGKYMMADCPFADHETHQNGYGCYFITFADISLFPKILKADGELDCEAILAQMRTPRWKGITFNKKRYVLHRRLTYEDIFLAAVNIATLEKQIESGTRNAHIIGDRNAILDSNSDVNMVNGVNGVLKHCKTEGGRCNLKWRQHLMYDFRSNAYRS